MKRLVLVGAGHAHARVLREFALHPPSDIELTLVSSVVQAPYSGMMPGWLAGHYRWDECTIDFAALVDAAGGRLIRSDARALDPDRRELTLDDGTRLGYDLLSLNVGSTLTPPAFEGTTVLPLRPLSRLHEQWEAWCTSLSTLPDRPLHVAAVGGGAAGVEILLAAQWRLARIAPARSFRFTLYTNADRLLPGSGRSVSKRLAALCEARGIELKFNTRIDSAIHRLEPTPDLLFWAAGAQAVSWLQNCGLATDAQGYVQVDSTLRSGSHANVFAVGDCAGWQSPLPKSGVYSVRMGPVLADNLRRAAASRPLQTYRPQARFLALISTGDHHAIASWGPFTFSGAWVWRWKDHIDRGFIRRYTIDSNAQGNAHSENTESATSTSGRSAASSAPGNGTATNARRRPVPTRPE